MKKSILIITLLLTLFSLQAQDSPVKKKKATVPQLINTDDEPKLKGRKFVALFDGETLDGWNIKQGTMVFEVKDGEIVGTCGPGRSTFLCTDKNYKDFIFSCEMRWAVDGNSGVQIRSNTRQDNNGETVFGPQAEMEDLAKKGRGWSGGIYGQSCGGWKYPLKSPEHKALKTAIDREGWNRLTIKVEGNVFKTWVNGIPAANWVDEANEFPDGFIGLQVHGGKQGTIHWRNLIIKEL